MLTKAHQHEEAEATGPASAPLDPAGIREHLDVILASDEFATSRRASELLQHLVDRALAGDSASLKERLLGVDIFHRRSDYNTSTDAIVRVTANDVRRRLAQFYSRHPDQPLRISLPLGSYIPDFIWPERRELDLHPDSHRTASPEPWLATAAPELPPTPEDSSRPKGRSLLIPISYAIGLLLAALLGWGLHSIVHTRSSAQQSAYALYDDILGPIGLPRETTEIAVTNPHVLLYLGLKSPGPALGLSTKDIPVSQDMAAVLNKTANDNQADFPYHHFFVDVSNYTGMGEAKAAFGLARVLQASGRTAQLTEERFLNWETARQEQLVILGAPHESKFVQETLSAANFTIEYNSIHNNHPLAGEQPEYSRSPDGDVLSDYGLIWMTQSPSGTRILVLAGLTSAGTAGVGEFFSDPERMQPIYQQLRSMAGSGHFPNSWQVLLHIQARQDVPVKVTPVAVRITR